MLPKRPTLLLTGFLSLLLAACGTSPDQAELVTQATFGGYNVNVVQQDSWNGGFKGAVVLKNTGGATAESFEIKFKLNGNNPVTQSWAGTFSKPAGNGTITLTSPDYLKAQKLAQGQSFESGFVASNAFAGGTVTSLKVNGKVVGGGTGPTDPVDPTDPTDPDPTDPVDPTEPTDPPAPGTRVDNPFVGADLYTDPDWAANVAREAAATGGSLGAAMSELADTSTAVWLDRIGAIAGTDDRLSLEEHLDEALKQKGSKPLVIQVVIYDLPNRDCAALSSNGELRIAEGGLERYQEEYIDVIAELFSRPKYAGLRIVALIEPDSLPNLVTNLGEHDCQEANGPGGYVDGVQYALGTLGAIPNVYNYIDIGHSGWLGWSSNFGPTASLMAETVRGVPGGFSTVVGFISNTSNTTPALEPFLTDPDLNVGGQPAKAGKFYEFNPYFDEVSYMQAMRVEMISQGFPDTLGMLIDTSRNGWGGEARPAALSTSADLGTFVDASRIDRRPHRGGWCNQAGSGLGFRPEASPEAGIDAYVWAKPPGESDGISRAGVTDPDDPAKGFDAMCDPDAQSTFDSAFSTNALAGAPHAGRWFPEQFRMLVQNAYPPIQ